MTNPKFKGGKSNSKGGRKPPLAPPEINPVGYYYHKQASIPNSMSDINLEKVCRTSKCALQCAVLMQCE